MIVYNKINAGKSVYGITDNINLNLEGSIIRYYQLKDYGCLFDASKDGKVLYSPGIIEKNNKLQCVQIRKGTYNILFNLDKETSFSVTTLIIWISVFVISLFLSGAIS